MSDRMRAKLQSKEYRDAHVCSNTQEWLSRQIRILRRSRGWTRQELAERVGVTLKTVARMENPDHDGPGIRSLLNLASVFDVAFIAEFVSFDDLLKRREDLSPDAMHVQPFSATERPRDGGQGDG